MAISRTNPLYVPPIQQGQAFVADYQPPDYLIDGLLQKGFVYSMTGQTGTGKTAVALRLAYSLASGETFGSHGVLKPGPVLYLAGENPTDIQQRWATMQREFGFEMANHPVYFMPGTWKIDKAFAGFKKAVEALGIEFSLVIIDTMAAFYFGEDENDNVEAGRFAREVRNMAVELPGHPSVLICCHPVKRGENTLPRGGGAFLAEVDGNLVCTSNRRPGAEEATIPVVLSWAGKWRGPDFEKIPMKLVGCDGALPDSRGRVLPSVYADTLSELEIAGQQQATALETDPEAVEAIRNLLQTAQMPMSARSIAMDLQWTYSTGKPQTDKALKVLLAMKKAGMVQRDGKKQWCVVGV